jgi:hypothetical protein
MVYSVTPQEFADILGVRNDLRIGAMPLEFRVRSMTTQQGDDIGKPRFPRVSQWRAFFVVLRAQVGPLLQQQGDDRRMTAVSRVVQRALAIFVLGIDVGAVFDQ